MIENVDIEFKELDRMTGAIPDSAVKEIIAFANTEGGEIYFGVSNDGTVIGVQDPDDTMTRLSNIAHNTILPDVIPFIQIRTIEMDGKPVVKVSVSVGTERPYYLAREGLKPRGVYVRRGSACIPVNVAGIREMLMETSGKSFEEGRSLDQELTFHTFEDEMRRSSLECGPTQMKTLKLIGSDGLFTNLGLLLSDQCPFTIKAAVFQGEDNAVFRERQEFSGSVLRQLNEAYHFLDFYNRTEARFNGLRREDCRDYPEEAVREALLNSIVHRDYLFSGSTIINMYADHMEFISLGGLVRGLSLDAVFMGASQSRNPNLAAVFYRLNLVESYGTGVRKILRSYESSERTPIFKTAEGIFSVELPSKNGNTSLSSPVPGDDPSNIQNGDILRYIQKKGSVTRKSIEDEFHFGATKAYKVLMRLCEEGRLRQEKQGKQTKYVFVR